MFFEIWKNAYNAYSEGDYPLMWDYLREQINNGNIGYADAEDIAKDVVSTFDL